MMGIQMELVGLCQGAGCGEKFRDIRVIACEPIIMDIANYSGGVDNQGAAKHPSPFEVSSGFALHMAFQGGARRTQKSGHQVGCGNHPHPVGFVHVKTGHCEAYLVWRKLRAVSCRMFRLTNTDADNSQASRSKFCMMLLNLSKPLSTEDSAKVPEKSQEGWPP
jgi:hypothetical protein